MSVNQDIWPDIAIHPGETVADLIEQRGLTQAKVAELMGRPPQVINEIVRGKKNITAETAVGLEAVLDMPAQFWTNLQAIYDNTRAHIAERTKLEAQVPLLNSFRYNELVRRGWVEHAKDKTERVRVLCKYLGVASLHQHAATLPASFRITGGSRYSDEALAVWLRRGELLARDMELPGFDRDRFRDVLPQIRRLTTESPEVFRPRMADLCESAGVALVFVQELPKVGANGVTRWLHTGNPLIQLNLKWKWADILWFTFFHEAGHVMQPKRHDVMHYGKRQATDTRYESEANQFASDILIPPDRWRYIKHEAGLYLPRARVAELAREVGIDPGIIVGRLQHERVIRHSEMNNLRRQYVWAE